MGQYGPSLRAAHRARGEGELRRAQSVPGAFFDPNGPVVRWAERGTVRVTHWVFGETVGGVDVSTCIYARCTRLFGLTRPCSRISRDEYDGGTNSNQPAA